jgi:hypothetical protein
MMHVNTACPCCISMLRDHDACLRKGERCKALAALRLFVLHTLDSLDSTDRIWILLNTRCRLNKVTKHVPMQQH